MLFSARRGEIFSEQAGAADEIRQATIVRVSLAAPSRNGSQGHRRAHTRALGEIRTAE
jgi:hypothetical protein